MRQVCLDSVRELLRVNEDGSLVWLRNRGRGVRAGDIAGALSPAGYWDVTVLGVRIRAHRVVFALTHGRWPVGEVDHINGNPADNRPENLREASVFQNRQNGRARSNNTSGHKGVCYDTKTGRWTVRVRAFGHVHWFGRHDDAELAGLIYQEAARKLHGEFYSTR